jgi:hypothetical protein
MLKRVAVVAAAAAVLALGPGRADSREQEELHLQVTCKPPSFKIRRPLLILNGTCPLSDGIILKVNLSRVTETVSGAAIQPTFTGAGNGTCDIEGKKFLYDAPIDGPGKYNVQISLVEDLQEKHLAAEVKKKAGTKRNWQFEFLVWGDELITQISPKLNDMHTLVTETRDLIKRFERAAASKEGWAAESKPLVAEGTKFQAKLEHHELKAFYPGAMNELFYTVRNVVNNAPYYTYGADGKFSGAKDYHADNEKVKTYRGEEFNWENLKRYVESALPVAGREFSLWVVKDIRRTGASRPEIVDAVKAQKAAPGVDFYQERLQKAGISDVDALEADIRGLKPDGSPKDRDPEKK